MAVDRSRLVEYDKLCQSATKELQADHYQEAEKLFNEAIVLNPVSLDAYCSRATVYIKLEKFELARKDAELVIQALRPKQDDPSAHNALASAFMKGKLNEMVFMKIQNTSQYEIYFPGGVASFRLGQYDRAKDFFKEGNKFDSSSKSGFNQWMIWCDEKLAKLEAQGKKVDIPPKLEDKSGKPDDKPISSKEDTPQIAMPAPKIKHDWYQTETAVVVEVRIKGLNKDQVTVDFEPRSLSVTAKLPQSQSDYSLEIDLSHEIQPEKCTFKVLSTKLEIKMLKKDGIRWTVLEGEDPMPQPAAASATSSSSSGNSSKPPSHPSRRDWSKIEKDLDKELESEKAEGEAALNELFAKIYKDADDDTRRAMNKSYQESGGTVLSTNWEEIKKEKTTVKPPGK